MRHVVRSTASVLTNASCGRQTSASSAWVNRTTAERSVMAMCSRNTLSGGLRNNCCRIPRNAGETRTPTTTRVQSRGEGRVSHPASNSSSSATGTRLRRRLSAIFHSDSAESGFRCRRPSPTGTQGNSQLAICQSPRIQRWWRETSARYDAG